MRFTREGARPAGCFYFKYLSRLSALFIETDAGPAYPVGAGRRGVQTGWPCRNQSQTSGLALAATKDRQKLNVPTRLPVPLSPRKALGIHSANSKFLFGPGWATLSFSEECLHRIRDFLGGLIPPRPPLCLGPGQGSQANKISCQKTREVLGGAGDTAGRGQWPRSGGAPSSR